MDDRIKEHLQRLNRYHLKLKSISNISGNAFISDDIKQAATERILQMAIESCLNIGNRLLSLIQFEQPVVPPETYADIFIQLHQAGIIDSALSKQMVKMAKFRNRLVHMYWQIEPESVYRILKEDINDFQLYRDAIVDYFNQKI